MNKIFYWSPFTSKVATVKSVINSVYSVNKYLNKDLFKATIIDAVHEWKGYSDILQKKNIDLIYLNKSSIFNGFKKDGFLRSRLSYWYIFFKSFNPLHKVLKREKPDFLIIHLITSLPLILFFFRNYETKLILRISGLPKLTFLRKILWKLACKNVYKITCPTNDTLKDLNKYDFLRDKLCILHDPIINLKDIKILNNSKINIDDKIKDVVENKKFLLSIGRFTKQKNFLFYAKCIPEIINLDKDLYFLFIGEGELKLEFLEIVKKLNISDKVLTINYTNNVNYFMKKSKALVVTSLWEDPGFVIVEAGYNNCQVISSNCPNGPSEIIDKDGGYLFESNSKKDFLKTIKLFLNEKKNSKKKRKIALKKRLRKFTLFRHSVALKKMFYFNDKKAS